jgi:hypothetical protein
MAELTERIKPINRIRNTFISSPLLLRCLAISSRVSRARGREGGQERCHGDMSSLDAHEMEICALFDKHLAGNRPVPPLDRGARHRSGEAQRITYALYLSFKQPVYRTNGKAGCNVVRDSKSLWSVAQSILHSLLDLSRKTTMQLGCPFRVPCSLLL